MEMDQERSGSQRMKRKDNIATNVNASASGCGSGSADLRNGNDDKSQDLRVSPTRSWSWSEEADFGLHVVRDTEQSQSRAKTQRWSKAGSDWEMMDAGSPIHVSLSLSKDSTAR
jgi:hypothetical protein